MKKQEKIIENCHKSKDGWVNINYDLKEIEGILNEISPIMIFHEGNLNNYELLENGVYNFILYWDNGQKKYVLSIVYFNAPEFGTKHIMMNTRLNEIVPNDFIFSGEFLKKTTNDIEFHDTSSFYFGNKKTLQKVMTQYYIKNEVIPMFQEIISKEKDIKIIKNNFLEILKKNKIIPFGQTRPNILYKSKTIQDINEFIQNGEFKKQGDKETEYRNQLINILKDSFERLFLLEFNLSFNKTLDYGNQENLDEFIELLCDREKMIEFDIYETKDDCFDKINKIKSSCDYKKTKKTKKNKKK